MGKAAACTSGIVGGEEICTWEREATVGGGGIVKSALGPGGGKVCAAGGGGICGECEAGARGGGRGCCAARRRMLTLLCRSSSIHFMLETSVNRNGAEQVGGASAGGETRPEKEEMLALFSRCSKKFKRFARIE